MVQPEKKVEVKALAPIILISMKNAEESSQAVDFVQKKMKGLTGVNEVYTLPTFPHGNGLRNGNGKNSEEQKRPLET